MPLEVLSPHVIPTIRPRKKNRGRLGCTLSLIRKLSRKGRKQNHARENGVFMNKLWNHRVKTSTVQRREVLSARGDKCANAGLHRVPINASVNGASCLGIYYQTIHPPPSLLESPDYSGTLPILFRAPCSCLLSDFLRIYSFWKSTVSFACLSSLWHVQGVFFWKGSRAWHSVLLAEWRQTEAKLKFSQGRREGRH